MFDNEADFDLRNKIHSWYLKWLVSQSQPSVWQLEPQFLLSSLSAQIISYLFLLKFHFYLEQVDTLIKLDLKLKNMILIWIVRSFAFSINK